MLCVMEAETVLQVFAVSVIRLSPKTGKMSMEKLTQSFFLSCHTQKKITPFFSLTLFCYLQVPPYSWCKVKKKYKRGMARTKEKNQV